MGSFVSAKDQRLNYENDTEIICIVKIMQFTLPESL